MPWEKHTELSHNQANSINNQAPGERDKSEESSSANKHKDRLHNQIMLKAIL